ncbi:DUF4863 domain-containing protein [Massilia eurypsychrophila]|jgi:hypothetical protein|uniref:DUF4863 domain-containing protein n=1 Tax=Massilia eurypsychrophila TaxID=1485217 RepID=A0A2G8TBS5_9BURK|nr:DUF4863 family protein [Massilia eurypsychrophila]PIL43500.1 DUF4863 domain-containing protein [Massilia eurypsychrophila]
MDVNAFQTLVARITGEIAGAPLDSSLEAHLNAEHGPGSDTYDALAAACQAGVRDGWLCNREGGGIRYGRALKATDATHGFSVDVVDMENIAGPHHAHPNGEIDLIMPLTSGANFDTCPAGWCVYEPGSAHRPTVTEGRALVLYLLPNGAIDFTAAAA